MVRKQLGIMALVAMVVAFAVAAQAEDILLTNPGFELPHKSDGVTASTYSGWTVANPGAGVSAVVWNPTSTSFLGASTGTGNLPSTAEGSQCLWVTGNPQVFQFPGYAVEADKVYTLTAAIGTPIDRTFGSFGLSLASMEEQASIVFTDDATGITSGSGLFHDKTISFNTGGGGYSEFLGDTLVIYIGGDNAAIDNIRLTVSDVPEPGAVMLLTTGTLVGLLACVWRRVRNRIR